VAFTRDTRPGALTEDHPGFGVRLARGRCRTPGPPPGSGRGGHGDPALRVPPFILRPPARTKPRSATLRTFPDNVDSTRVLLIDSALRRTDRRAVRCGQGSVWPASPRSPRSRHRSGKRDHAPRQGLATRALRALKADSAPGRHGDSPSGLDTRPIRSPKLPRLPPRVFTSATAHSHGPVRPNRTTTSR
jgi:hypothetical protein